MLRKFLDRQAPLFGEGGRFARLYPLYEAIDTFLYTPGDRTNRASFVRDAADLKRLMITVVIALVPAILFGVYNVGHQAALALSQPGIVATSWQAQMLAWLNVPLADPDDILACFVHGLAYYLPILLVTFIVGGVWEVLFAVVRRHEVNEGFLVTGMLLPLIVPPTIPLWQVALAISFGVVIAKEIFGGVGYNIFNPALAARAFLFFAYPGQISGNAPWVAVDGWSTATPTALFKEQGLAAMGADIGLGSATWMESFWGFVPGSIGETSFVAIALGALLLLVTGVASWRIMLGVLIGTLGMSLLFNAAGSTTNPMMSLPFHWHIVIGGWAFGTVFMATDPVTAPFSQTGRLLYGLLIGVMVMVVRVLNPAYPEGMMLSILMANLFGPLIDYYVVQAHKKKRMARYVA
ncbi:MAG: NADH:ubiquinone reductase (Na(+)-transporting) subunit B [Myxococcales bacterium]|jgi:Na+-transporting NADH:ubiquinone oxidoreductase subunit B|nr:NADH:ubiquinone reductase (Na(+)-transporting) subunit B [Myxococcales bacterium]